MKKDIDYDFVRPLLNAFIYSKLADPSTGEVSMDSPYGIETPHGLINSLEYHKVLKNLADHRRDIYLQWIHPWDQLNLEQLQTMLEILNAALGPKFKKRLELNSYNVFQALHWTVIQVINAFPSVKFLPIEWDGNVLDYSQKGFPDKQTFPAHADFLNILYLSQEHTMPVRQCVYCGKRDIDQGGKAFSKRRKLCHLQTCKSSDSDTKDHEDGCCYKAWRKIKKNFDASCANKRELTEKFEQFFEKHYQNNLNLNQPVRVLKAKPNSLKFVYENDVLFCEASKF